MRVRSIPFAAMAALLLAVASVSAFAAPVDSGAVRPGRLLDALMRADFAGASGQLAPELAAKLDAGKLKQTWNGLQGQAGAYVSHAASQNLFLDNAPVVVMPLRFAKAPLDMLVSCDGQGQVSALHFMPPEIVAVVAQKTASRAVQTHVQADGVRVSPLGVPTPAGPLHGALTLPAGHGPFPAVVLVAGSGAQDMDETLGPNKPFRDIANALAREGVASLRYDKRPYDYPKSWSDKSGPVIDAEVTEDAVTAARLLARQKPVDPQRVFVLGHSLGAMMAPRVGQRDPQLAGLVLMASSARRILDVMEQQTREQTLKAGGSAADAAQAVQPIAKEKKLLAAASPGQVAPQGDFEGQPQGYWVSWSRVDPVADAKALSMPMLIVQGGSDFQVSPTRDFARWKQVLAGRPQVAFHLYPGLSHLFMPAGKTGTLVDYGTPGHVDAQVLGDIAAWIKSQVPTKGRRVGSTR
jgi:uncharacterized protein